ncbi:hypothetical protein LEP1GSC170_1255 [Leptospira interrogans serovar Bataviae str. HAI135]|nr:hypothetical protein LEP1GSC170_1255 [Leptospira interrogans serovar Bataviae str. HAI135]
MQEQVEEVKGFLQPIVDGLSNLKNQNYMIVSYRYYPQQTEV